MVFESRPSWQKRATGPNGGAGVEIADFSVSIQALRACVVWTKPGSRVTECA